MFCEFFLFVLKLSQDKKEKNRWMRRPKQKRNADHGNPEPISHNSSLHDFNLKTEPLTKSRSLESLKDSMKIQDGQNDVSVIKKNFCYYEKLI